MLEDSSCPLCKLIPIKNIEGGRRLCHMVTISVDVAKRSCPVTVTLGRNEFQ